MSRSVEPPLLQKHGPQNSNKRSALFMDPEVIEIPPSPSTPHVRQNSKLLKQKEVSLHEVIDIDKDEDYADADVMYLGKKFNTFDSGKPKGSVSVDSGGGHNKEALSSHILDRSYLEPVKPASDIHSPISRDITNANSVNTSEMYNEVDRISDFLYDDFLDIDKYAILQKHFDNVDLPTGVEVPVHWFSLLEDQKKAYESGSSFSKNQVPSEASVSNLVGGSSLQVNANAISNSSIMELYRNKSYASLSGKNYVKPSFNTESSISQQHFGASLSQKNLSLSSVSNDYGYLNYPHAVTFPIGAEPSLPGFVNSPNQVMNTSCSFQPDFILPVTNVNNLQEWWHNSYTSKVPTPSPEIKSHTVFNNLQAPPVYMPVHPFVGHTAQFQTDRGASNSHLVHLSDEERAEIMRKFQVFKQFDTVVDHSDHYYTNLGVNYRQAPKNWAKKIQEEWNILVRDLPDTIYVRVYETRIDLLRAVIIGAEGTPYHDGLFFFDISFPSDYPNVPPKVHYHSGGLRLNPNLYHDGKVCLSLLNTWSGKKNEKWIPGQSTILQVLVSIQGLILNTKPYFNEPGYQRLSGSPKGEKLSLQYNEDTFMLSLRTMMYTMSRPQKHFEDFIAGHFCNRAHDILVACKAYMSGAQVGCLVKGGIQDVDEGDKSSSQRFKDSLVGYVNMLIKDFTRVGAKDCAKFLCPG